jgi:hypothetical protein
LRCIKFCLYTFNIVADFIDVRDSHIYIFLSQGFSGSCAERILASVADGKIRSLQLPQLLNLMKGSDQHMDILTNPYEGYKGGGRIF